MISHEDGDFLTASKQVAPRQVPHLIPDLPARLDPAAHLPLLAMLLPKPELSSLVLASLVSSLLALPCKLEMSDWSLLGKTLVRQELEQETEDP